MRRLLRELGLWAPVGAYMAAIPIVSNLDVPGVEMVWDKALHCAAYALMGLLALRACHGGIAAPRRLPSLAAFAITAGYGLVDEWIQSMVPGRDPSLRDWAADLVGFALALAATSAAMAVVGRWGRQRENEPTGDRRR